MDRIYLYIFTGDSNWEKRLERGVKFARQLEKPVLFGVNGVRPIHFLRKRGFKGVNLDSIFDLPNWIERNEIVYCDTPEKWEILTSYLPNLQPIPKNF